MPTEEEILAEMQALAEAVSTDKAVTDSNLNRTRTDVALSKANKDAAALAAGAAASAKTAAENAKAAAIAAKETTLIHVDGAVWYPDGWNVEDVFPVAASLVYGGTSYRALVENQNVEPGTDPQTWMVILDIPPEVYEARDEAEAAVVAATAQKTAAVAAKTAAETAASDATAQKTAAIAAKNEAAQKASDALSSQASSAASATSAAGSAAAANAAAAGAATVVDSFEELEENTTALTGQVLEGDDAGFYKRAIANDPSSNWERSSVWTVPGLGVAVSPLVGESAPSTGWLDGTDHAYPSIVVDQAGGGVYSTHPDGRMRLLDSSGQWAAETTGRPVLSVGFLREDDLLSPSATLDESGRLVQAIGRSGAPLFPGLDGVLRDDLSERGPSQGYLAEDDSEPAAFVATDAAGRLLPSIGFDGAVRWPDSLGRWKLGVSVEDGPSKGWLDETADDAVPVASLQIDNAGRPMPTIGLDGLTRWQDSGGTWRVGTGVTDALSTGWLSEFDEAPAANVFVDHAGRATSTIGQDGVVSWPDHAGAWRRGPYSATRPSVGWVADDGDSAATHVTLDDTSRLVSANAAGSPWVVARYVAAPSGLIRQETPSDGPQVTVSGPLVQVPPTRVPRSSGWLHTPAVVLTSPAPTPATVTSEAKTIRYNDAAWLAYQFVRDVVVTRVSDSVVLTEGTHYEVDGDRGIITGLVDTASYAVTVAYTGHPVRSDLVTVHPRTGVVSIATGTERPRSASMFDPDVPSGEIALYRIFRFVDGAELVPLYLYRKIVRIDRAASIEADIAEQRRRARWHRAIVDAKVRTSETLKWCGEGDSITAMGSGDPSVVNVAPNGPRQRLDYFQLYDSTALALIPTEDRGDGYGNTYVREGWNWNLLTHLINTYGVSVNYRNWGIGGTDSSDVVNSSGFRCQGNADKIAAIIAESPDIICYVPGMNELGESFTYANVRAICETYLAEGIAVILGTPARPNERWRARLARWRDTCAQIEQVSDDLLLPCFKSSRVLDVSSLAGCGIAEREICDATMQNHPGLRELRAIGDLAIDLF